MKQIKKIAIISLIVIVIAVIGGSFYAGNFFVDYALYRPSEGQAASTEDGRAPQNVENPIVEENMKADWKEYDQWIVNIEPKDISIQSEDGLTLKSIEYNTNPDSDTWAILVHGYQASNQSMRREAMHFSNEGYNVLTPNNRAHGDSEGNYIGMGWLDRFDILLWIDYIIEKNPNAQIILYGESMGGATVSMVAGEELPSNVKAIIEDCGYTTVYDMFVNQLDYRFGLPEFPFM